MAKMNVTQTINGMTRDQMAQTLKAQGAKMIVPKGVSGEMVRFEARDHQFNTVACAMCLVTDFAVINAIIMKVD